MTNDTLLVLFKNLNKLGSQGKFKPVHYELYNSVKTELEKRLDKTLPQWTYKLYPNSITHDLVDWDHVNEVLENAIK